MNRRQYMERLEQLLLVLPQDEREEALLYYEDYFEDAGMENEESVIHKLGSPEEVAAKIRSGYAGEYGEYSECGYEDSRFEYQNHAMTGYHTASDGWESYEEEERTETGSQYKKKSRGKNTENTNIWKVIAIALLLLIVSPIILPLGIAMVAVMFAIIVALLAIILCIGISGFAVIFAGVVILAAGIGKVLLLPATGLLAMGIGCIVLAIGILVSWIMITLAIKVVPGVIRGIVKLLSLPFRKAGA